MGARCRAAPPLLVTPAAAVATAGSLPGARGSGRLAAPDAGGDVGLTRGAATLGDRPRLLFADDDGTGARAAAAVEAAAGAGRGGSELLDLVGGRCPADAASETGAAAGERPRCLPADGDRTPGSSRPHAAECT